MSTMLHPSAVDDVERAEIAGCTECQADRRPRMYVCSYHEGWLAGREVALSVRLEPTKD